MWFYGKTPEEINARLQKEGVVTKLINAVKAKNNEERLEEFAHEPLITGEETDDLATVAKYKFVPFVSGIRPPENIEKIKSYSVLSERNKVGDAILYLVEQAEEEILLTHFFMEQYLPMYIAVQLEKLGEGVVLERIVEEHLEHSDYYKWLHDFHDDHGNPIKNYKQYPVSFNRLFNFDFMIIDKKIVILVYRGYTFDDALIFENESMVKIYLNLWNNLKLQEEGDRDTEDLKEDIYKT